MGFALYFDWVFDRLFNAPPRFRILNKSLNRRLAGQSSPSEPPSPKRGEGEKSQCFPSIQSGFDTGVA